MTGRFLIEIMLRISLVCILLHGKLINSESYNCNPLLTVFQWNVNQFHSVSVWIFKRFISQNEKQLFLNDKTHKLISTLNSGLADLDCGLYGRMQWRSITAGFLSGSHRTGSHRTGNGLVTFQYPVLCLLLRQGRIQALVGPRHFQIFSGAKKKRSTAFILTFGPISLIFKLCRLLLVCRPKLVSLVCLLLIRPCTQDSVYAPLSTNIFQKQINLELRLIPDEIIKIFFPLKLVICFDFIST